MRGNIKLVAGLVLLSAVVFTGCAKDEVKLTAESEIFAGLPNEIVQEVLAHPLEKASIEEEPSENRENLAQVRVQVFWACRAEYDIYQAWLTTGIAPTMPAVPAPEHPANGPFTMGDEQKDVQAIIDSGDPDELKDWLTLEGTCGKHVPLHPNQPTGPTIKDAIEGK
jgi:hypothetical protein